MPPKAKFSKEDIIKAALELTRKSGASSVTARALAEQLGTSVKPIFGLFSGMEELKKDVLDTTNTIYQSFLANEMTSGQYPPYKASGIGYIKFAREEKELFKLLFMRDRSGESITEDRESIRPIIDIIKKNTGFSDDTAYRFHLEQWIFVHGIASMIATNYILWTDEDISQSVSRVYNGLKAEYEAEMKNNELCN